MQFFTGSCLYFKFPLFIGTCSPIGAHHLNGSAADHALTDSSIVLNVPDPFVTGYLRWTYDVQGRPATQVGFQGADSVGFNSYTYTPTGKPAENFRSQLLGGTWYNTTEAHTYNTIDSLTDKVVTSDFLSYEFHWAFSPEGWLVHYEELTPSGNLFIDHYHHPNGKLLATHTHGQEFGPQDDSTFFSWNATFDTVLVSVYNLFFSATEPNTVYRYAYNTAGEQVEYIGYDLVGMVAVPSFRQATTRDANGHVLVDSTFTWDGSVFVHQANENFAYDADGHKLERILAHRVGIDMVPVFQQFWTYNALGQLTSTGDADTLGGAWVTSVLSRWYYEEYALGLAETALTNLLNVYPVPSDGEVTVTWARSGTAMKIVRVFDQQGRSVVSRSGLTGTSIALDLNGHAAGPYVIEVNDGTRIERRTIVLK